MGIIKNKTETLFYVSVSVGLAVSSLSFTVVSGIFEIVEGFWILAAVLLGGGFCYVIASCMSELASRFPASPGIRTYLSKGFGNRLSIFFSYLYVFFIILIGGIESNIFSLVVEQVFPEIPQMLTITFLLVLILSVNLFNLEFPRIVQIGLAIFLVSSVFFLGFMGLGSPDLSFEPLNSELSAGNLFDLAQALGISLFLFVGFEWVTTLGLNASAYKQKIPFSMKTAICINTLMFFVLCLGIILNMDATEIVATEIPQVLYAKSLFGIYGVYFALAISLLAILSTFNAGVIAGARFVYLLGREGVLPKITTKVSFSSGAPIGAIMVLSLLVYLGSFLITIFEIQLESAIICSAIICFIYAFLILSLLRIKRQKDLDTGKNVFISSIPNPVKKIIIALLFVFGTLSIFSIEDKILFISSGVLILSALSYLASFWYTRKTEKG